VEVEAWAFELRPDLPPEGLPRDVAYRGRHLRADYLQHLRQTAEQAGLHLNMPPLVANTRLAHEATEFAKEQGDAQAFSRTVFAAYWEHEEDIGKADVLCRLAGEIGMGGDALREALSGGRYRQRVVEQLEWCRREGVTGVPTFVFSASGRFDPGEELTFALVGAQTYDVFKSVAERIMARRSAV
jgi:predicted DsbA family dithiol-disulfide isomerase